MPVISGAFLLMAACTSLASAEQPAPASANLAAAPSKHAVEAENLQEVRAALNDLITSADLLTGLDAKAQSSLRAWMWQTVAPEAEEVERHGRRILLAEAPSPQIRAFTSRPDSKTQSVAIWFSPSLFKRGKMSASYAPGFFTLGLLHELENARRAESFLKLAESAQTRQLAHDDFVKAEVLLEAESIVAAVEKFRRARRSWPLSGTLPLEDVTSHLPAEFSVGQALTQLPWDDIKKSYSDWYKALPLLSPK